MYERTQGTFDTPGGNKVQLHFRTETNDFNTLWSSLNEDEYHLPTGLTGVALDIGGYLGSVGIALAIDNPGLERVVIVEPVPDNCDLIGQNIAQNNLGDRVSLIQGAVGKANESVEVWYGYTGTVSLEHHAFVGNSTLAYDDGGKAPHESITYDATQLADLVDLIDVERYGPWTDHGDEQETHPHHEAIRFAYMKIDVEGAEWAFLDSPEIWRVDTVVGEWHPVRHHTMGDLIALFDPTHEVTFDGPQAGPGGFRAVRR